MTCRAENQTELRSVFLCYHFYMDRLRDLNPVLKKVFGVIFVLLGFLALITPLTPGSWLALIGFELLGIRLLFIDKITAWLRSRKEK